MSFEADLLRFRELVSGRITDMVTLAGIEVQRSVVEGSEITAAPGQPVDTGFLKGSFIPKRISDTEWQLTTNVSYAPAIESGVQADYDEAGVERPPELATQGGTNRKGPSQVGGPHSVALTRAAWPLIADIVAEQVKQ